MKDIKVKEVSSKTIKSLDKSTALLKNTKENLVNVKGKDESINESASDKIITGTNYVSHKVVDTVNLVGKKSFENTKKDISKLKDFKVKRLIKKDSKEIVKSGKNVIKISNKTIKTTTKIPIQTSQTIRKTKISIKQITTKSVTTIKRTTIYTIRTLKYALLGAKALISALIAGGWIMAIVIIVICLIGLLCSSIFGIFFSGSDTGNDSILVSDVVKSIDLDFAERIVEIQEDVNHDEYILDIDRASWNEVLALYTTRITGGEGNDEVLTMNDSKKVILQELFWDMHTINHELKTEIVQEERIDDEGNSEFVDVEKNVLYIIVESKSVEEMINYYNLTINQQNEINELLQEEYQDLWSSAIYGIPIGNSDIVSIAKSQLGNVGGQPYWSWYGYSTRVEWCATFVSWVANEAGYIEANIIPKFSAVVNGVAWFQMMGQWQEADFIPKAGTIIFYDWEQDGKPDHVGIVEKVEDNIIYTIEGNMSNKVVNLRYNINSIDIYGYGTPNY